MAYGPNHEMRTVHLVALKSPNAPKHEAGKREGQVNVTGYIQNWNRNCAKGEKLGDSERVVLSRWLNGGKGENFKYSQKGGAKRQRRSRNRKEEGKKVVKTTDTFVFE